MHEEMNRLNILDARANVFCRRVSGSVLTGRYRDFTHEKLLEIYEKDRIRVLIERSLARFSHAASVRMG